MIKENLKVLSIPEWTLNNLESTILQIIEIEFKDRQYVKIFFNHEMNMFNPKSSK